MEPRTLLLTLVGSLVTLGITKFIGQKIVESRQQQEVSAKRADKLRGVKLVQDPVTGKYRPRS